MRTTEIKELYKTHASLDQQEVFVTGWVRTIRDSKAFGFIELNDGTFFKNIQIVFSQDKLDNYAEIAALNVGAALRVRGILLETPESKQPFEIQAEEIIIEGVSTPDYPLQKKRHSVEYLRQIAHLRPVPICSLQYSASVLWLPLRFISSFMNAVLYTCIPPLLPEVTVKEQGKCSVLLP